jgi:hypothetical protein
MKDHWIGPYSLILALLAVAACSLDLRMKNLEMKLEAMRTVLIITDVIPKDFLKKEIK